MNEKFYKVSIKHFWNFSLKDVLMVVIAGTIACVFFILVVKGDAYVTGQDPWKAGYIAISTVGYITGQSQLLTNKTFF